jgi:hypothetical protein
MTKQIYLVHGYDYASSTTLCAYVNEQDALDFAEVCRQYDKSAPEPPVSMDNLYLYREWEITRNGWFSIHPAKSKYRFYTVETIELK